MNRIDEKKNRQIIEEQAETIRLLTDLTKAGSWVINYAPDGSLESVPRNSAFAERTAQSVGFAAAAY